MKRYFLNIVTLVLSVLLCNGVFAQVNSSNGKVPFGSKGQYQYGIVPTNAKSDDAASAYNTWKNDYVTDCNNGSKRVKFDDPNSTVSEGIAYGMLLSAYANDKATFDGLWQYYKNNRNGNGVMNWKISGCSGASGQNGATDAELDAAMALIIADIQWPGGSYNSDAVNLIQKIKTYEMAADGQTLNGDAWGNASTCRNPSYFAPAYYVEFAKVDAANASFWSTTAINASNYVLKKNMNSKSGLISNWCDNNGTENACGPTGSGGYGYGADACRNPWRMAVDYLWHGNSCSEGASAINAKLVNFVKGHESNVCKGPFDDRNISDPGSGRYQNGSYSTMALPMMASSNQNSLDLCYSAVKGLGNTDVYFNTTIRCITMFVLTGNFWSPDAAGAKYPPKVLSAETDEDGNIILTTSKELTGSANASTFTVYYDGASQNVVSSVTLSGEKVIVNVSKAASPGQVIQVSYNGEGNIKSSSDGVAMKEFTKQSVISMVAGSQVIIDEVSDGNEFNNLGGIWFSYNDADDGNGKPSTVSVIEPVSSSGTPFKIYDDVNGPDGKPYCISARFKLGSGTKGGEYDSYVGIGTYMHKDNDNGVVDWSENTGVTFMYKGPQCMLNFVMTDNCSWDIHHYVVPTCNDWTRISILFTELIQEGWGDQKPFDPTQVVKLQWQFKTKFPETPKNMSNWAYAYIDDVKLMTQSQHPITALTKLDIDLVSASDLTKSHLSANPNPKEMSIASGIKGDTLYLETTPTPSNATYPVVLWESSDETVAKVDYKGRVLGVGYGKATITARSKMHQSIIATYEVVVPAPAVKPTAVTFTPSEYEITVGESMYLTPIFTPDNATELELSWESSANAKVTVTSDGKIEGIAEGSATITATSTAEGCSNVKATVEVTVKPVQVTDVVVTKDEQPVSEVILEMGGIETVTAAVLPAAANQEVIAVSGSESIATVTVNGNEITIASAGVGETTVTVKSKADETKTASISVTVNDIAITGVTITGTETEIFVGGKTTLTAQVSPGGADQSVTWTTSDDKVATVSAGVVTGVGVGPVTITATSTKDDSKSDTYTIEVKPILVSKITVSAASNDPLKVNGTVQLSATVEPDGATNKAFVWSSEDNEIAEVSEEGLVTAKKIGSCKIYATAQDESGVVGEYTITVEATKVTSITVLPAEATVYVGGETLALHATVSDDATDKTYTWSSTAEDIATVDENGVVTAVKAGECTIKATANDGGGAFGQCAVTVENIMPISITMASTLGFTVGDEAKSLLPLTFNPENTTDQTVTWESDNTDVATVVDGVVTPIGEGECNITVTSLADNNVKAVCHVSVVANTIAVTDVELPATESVYYGKTVTLTPTFTPSDATNKAVSWVSSDPSTVSVDANGVVKGEAIGHATITVTTEDGGHTANCEVTVSHKLIESITITPATLELTVASEPKQLKADYLPEDATSTELTWSVDKSEVATVSQTGVVEPKGEGVAVITVKNGDVTQTCTVTVSAVAIESVELDNKTLTFTMGDDVQTLKATVSPAEANQTVTWESDDTDVATVLNGVVTPKGVGTCKITASAGGKSDVCDVTVNPKPVEGVALDKETMEIPVNGSGVLNVEITPANATNKNVTWESSEPSIATVEDGVVKGVAAGTTTITVTTVDGGKTATCEVTVKANTIAVTGVTLSPSGTKTVALNETVTFTAQVAPSNATNKNVTWESSDPSVATINENGEVTLHKAGTTTITVTTEDGSISDQCELTVTNIMASQIVISNAVSLKVGEESTLSLEINPEGASQTAEWVSDNPSVATVDETGKVTAKTKGTANITATTTDGTNLTSNKCIVTVSNVSVTGVSFAASSKIMRLGTTETFNVTITPDNATIKDVTWKSTKPEFASVENGTVTANAVGTTTITATSADEDVNKYADCIVEVVDASELQSEIATANASYSAAVEGTEIGQYKSGSKATFMTAITAAQSVFDNADATQIEIDAALAALKVAEKAFEKAKIVNETLIFNADMKQENMTYMATYWFSFNDHTASDDPAKCGSSEVTPLSSEESPFTMSTPGYNGTGKAAMMQYTLEGHDALGYDPFVGMGLNFKATEGEAFDMTGSTGISFWIKSDSKVYFEVELTGIKDACDYFIYLDPYPEWTLVELSWSDLAQYTWGKKVTWDLKELTKCQWKVQEADGETGRVWVDEVKILGVALDLPEIVDYDALYTAIADAEALLDAAVVGSGDGNYPQSAVTMLTNAKTTAEGVINNATTQSVADNAVTTLRTAIAAFEAAKISVDKSVLVEKIELAYDYYQNSVEGYQEGNYIKGSRQELLTAILAAEDVNDAATSSQAEVNAAIKALGDAIDKFLNSKFDPNSINRTALQAALSEANTLYTGAVEGYGDGQYPNGTKQILLNAITSAQTVNDSNSSSQEEIDQATASLRNAIEAFTNARVKVNKTILNSTISTASALHSSAVEGFLKGNYPEGSKAILNSAIESARTVYNNANSSQDEVDQANITLKNAIDEFKAKVITVDKSTLSFTISKAQSSMVKAEGNTGDGSLQFPQSAVDMLQTAIAEAQGLYETATSQQIVNDAVTSLNKAIETFENSRNPEEVSLDDLIALIIEADALIDNTRNPSEYMFEFLDLVTCNSNARAEQDKTTHLQENVNTQVQRLSAAIEKFKKAQDAHPWVAIDETEFAQLSVFPNPCQNELSVVAGKEMKSVAIVSIIGATQFVEEVNATEVTVDVTAIKAGYYFVKIAYTDGSVETVKFMKR